MRTASGIGPRGPCHHRGRGDTFLAQCLASLAWRDNPVCSPGRSASLARCFWLQQRSFFPADVLLGDHCVVKAMAESRAGYFHVPLYWGEMHALAEMRQAPQLGKGDPWQPPPLLLAGDIFSFPESAPESVQSSEAVEHHSFFHRQLDAVPIASEAHGEGLPRPRTPQEPMLWAQSLLASCMAPWGWGSHPRNVTKSGGGGGGHTSFSLSFFLINLPDYLLILLHSADIMCTFWLCCWSWGFN